MVLTNTGRNLIRDGLQALTVDGGVGISSTDAIRADTGLLGGGTTVDDCDAITGWSASGDASSVSLNTTSEEFQQGTGCLNLPASAGTATWQKTVTSYDNTGGMSVLWFYMDNATDLTTGVAVTVTFGNAGVINSAEFTFNKSLISNGWNSLICDFTSTDNYTENGTFDITDIDTLQLDVALDFNQNTNDMRMDYWRYYEPSTLGITDSIATLDIETGDYYFKTRHEVDFSESNGLDLVESADSDQTNIITRQTFAKFRKGQNVQVVIDKYYYIDQE